jgi:hypothetical protein
MRQEKSIAKNSLAPSARLPYPCHGPEKKLKLRGKGYRRKFPLDKEDKTDVLSNHYMV